MAGISSTRSRSRSLKGPAYHPLQNPPRQPISAEAECAREKLSKIQDYQDLKPTEVKKLAVDLTDAERMKSMWFATGPEDGEREGEAAPAVQRGEPGPRRVSVELFIAHPQEERREFTHSGSVAAPGSIERRFECFCSYGVCSEAAVRVDGVYLKWEPNSLVYPKGEKIRDDTEGAQPFSIGDEQPMGLGESENLDQLLQLVADYNARHVYNSFSQNSKDFVRDALNRLGKDVPPLLVVFENYRQRISDMCQGIKKQFNSHRELDEYYSRSNHETITKNKRYIEYLFFRCVCFHVKSAGTRVGVNSRRGGMCTERDCCLPYLKSDLSEDDLIFDQFWPTFTANEGRW